MKEKLDKAKYDVKKFWKENKKKIVGGAVLGGGLIATGVVVYKVRKSRANQIDIKIDIPMVDEPVSEKAVKEAKDTIVGVFEHSEEANKRLWEAGGYQENWDKVSELVKNMKFAPGEAWILEEKSISIDAPYTGEGWIAGHLVNNFGIYPPDK